MKKAILVAHSSRDAGVGSNSKIKIITRAYSPLTFAAAREYMGKMGSSAEYSSVAIGTLEPLSDEDYRGLFDADPPAGDAAVNTGKRKGNDMGGPEIFALRGEDWSFDDVVAFAEDYTSVVLLACRG